MVEAQKRELEIALRTRDEIQQQLETELEDARLLHHPRRATACGDVLARGARLVVDDFSACDFIAGTLDADAFRAPGVQSAQSTPLLTRDGRSCSMR